jgi:hypothetical protein
VRAGARIAGAGGAGGRRAGGQPPGSDGLEYVIPMNIEPCSTIAGYLGLFSLLFWFLGPFAMGLGIWGLQRIAKDDSVRGKSRAWTGIVLGALGTAVLVLIVVMAVLN